jgi:hypothetical protein
MSKRVIAVCAMVVAALSTADVRAEKMVPFKGTWSGRTISATPSENSPIVSIVAAGGGQFTHLGRSTMVSPHTTNVVNGETIGDQIFTAANGDTLTAHCAGFGLPAPDFSSVDGVLDCHVIGGTGRFAGATGSYTFSFHSDLIPGPEIRFATVAAISGAISSVGSNK